MAIHPNRFVGISLNLIMPPPQDNFFLVLFENIKNHQTRDIEIDAEMKSENLVAFQRRNLRVKSRDLQCNFSHSLWYLFHI